MKALPMLALAALAIGSGLYWYKRRSTTVTSTPAQDDKPGGAVAPRTLSPEQTTLVTTLLADYLALAPTPVPGCASATLVAGRKPAAGESVSGDDRMAAKALAGAKVGDVYVDAVTAGAATLGTTPPGGVAVTIVDSSACPGVVANLTASGWFLYAKKSG